MKTICKEEVEWPFTIVSWYQNANYSNISLIKCVEIWLSLILDNNINYENIDDKTFLFINYIKQKIIFIYWDEILNQNITVRKAVKDILKNLIKSKEMALFISLGWINSFV